MSTSLGTETAQYKLMPAPESATSYYFKDSAASPALSSPTAINLATSSAIASTTMYGSQRHLFRDKFGNLIAIYIDSTNTEVLGMFKNYDDPNWTRYNTDLTSSSTVVDVSGGLDSSGNLHIAYEETATTSYAGIYYKKITITRDASNHIKNDATWTIPAATALDAGASKDLKYRPALVIDSYDYPAIVWARKKTGAGAAGALRFTRWNGSAWTCAAGSSCGLALTTGEGDAIQTSGSGSDFHGVLGVMPGTAGVGNGSALYAFIIDSSAADLDIWKATYSSPNYVTWSSTNLADKDTSVGAESSATPWELSVTADHIGQSLIYTWHSTTNYTKVARKYSGADANTSDGDLSPGGTNSWTIPP